MKQINKIFLLLILISGVTSCKKVLDTEPQQSIDASTALQNDQDVNSLIIGAYSRMGHPNLYGTDLLLMPDLLGSDDVCEWRGTFTSPDDIASKAMDRNNTDADLIWETAYDAINIANTAIGALGVVKDADLKKQLEGEALFVRGIMHFELVRLFALPWGATADNSQLGVVIKTDATKNEVDAGKSYPRNTVKEVYTQIVADLTKAITLLPEENPKRVTKYTALAFLSRVYLQQQNYAGARDAADQVIESGYYTLNASVNAVFNNKDTKESIWEIQQNDQNNAGTANNGMATFYASLPGIGRGDVRIDDDFVANAYPTDDLRQTQWYYQGTGARPNHTYCAKWTSFSQNLPVVRLAEMYLTRAEGNLVMGTTVGDTPGNDLAMVKNPLRTNSVAPANPTLNDIRNERFIELAFEGQRIHDLKRLRLPTGSYSWNSPKLVMPIPQREIDATRGVLIQNPGY
ncbi:MAG: RagB/SusD family nutrient uptake outer membrane protein [Bacteroidetes bacterium]|nr:RagB/SusD family nutrient uptake outer membrane protein [Bacteroidota bacterium]MBS1756375.1 RagB/SusD family nutrient uptake outer membrane protein [Bacteroidota bacterium]